MLLTFKPVIVDNYRQLPGSYVTFNMRLETVDVEWKPKNILLMDECPVHKYSPEIGCCGIHTSLDVYEIGMRYLRATNPQDYPLMITVVQTLGSTDLNENTWDVRAEKIYLWGVVRPRWMTNFSETRVQIGMLRTHGVYPAFYTSIAGALKDIILNNKHALPTEVLNLWKEHFIWAKDILIEEHKKG